MPWYEQRKETDWKMVIFAENKQEIIVIFSLRLFIYFICYLFTLCKNYEVEELLIRTKDRLGLMRLFCKLKMCLWT